MTLRALVLARLEDDLDEACGSLTADFGGLSDGNGSIRVLTAQTPSESCTQPATVEGSPFGRTLSRTRWGTAIWM